MNESLGRRHLQAARRTLHASTISVGILEDSRKEMRESMSSLRTKESLDDHSAISGDDLARINAFEPADPNLKPIGAQSGIWSDGRHHAGKWTA